MRNLWRLFVLVVVAMLFATASHSAMARGNHQIVIGESIAGVSIFDNLDRAHRLLGSPNAVKYVNSEFGITFRQDFYGKLAVISSGGSIYAIKTTRRNIRTRSGIRVGASKRKLERQYPNLYCYGATCRVSQHRGSSQIGKPVTDFRIKHGKIRSISIGRVVD